MKRSILFLIALASFAIASCTKDEVKEVNRGLAIDFRTVLTRATETTVNNLGGFHVTAITESETPYFSDLQFTKNGDYYSSSTKYYWPSDNSPIHFYAYAPSKEDLGVSDEGATLTVTKEDQTLTSFAPAADITAQKDFIVAMATGTKEDADEGVGLVFDHVLSQVAVVAYNSNPAYIVKVKGVRIGKVYTKADFTFQGKSWTNHAVKGNYDVTYDEARTLGNKKAEPMNLMKSEGDNAMLIPQTLTAWDAPTEPTNEGEGTYFSFLVNITTVAGAHVYPSDDSYMWLATPVDGVWNPGFKYVYVVDVTTGGFVDPETPVDPDGPVGPFGPGTSLDGGELKFSASMYSWSNNYPSDIEM